MVLKKKLNTPKPKVRLNTPKPTTRKTSVVTKGQGPIARGQPGFESYEDHLKNTNPKAKKPGVLERLKTWNEGKDGDLDRLGSMSKIAAQLGGDGLSGVSPEGTPTGKGAPGSIQYTKLDSEVDASQDKIRKQIQQLK